MRGPWASPLFEGDVIGRMPVSGEEDRETSPLESVDEPVDSRDYFVPSLHSEGASRTEITLYVDHQQGSAHQCHRH